MARRIIRTLAQIGAFAALLCLLVFIADSRYRVLPASIHGHLPSHHAGSVITDVTIAFCSSANPFSNCRLDPDKWSRVEKDLYLGSGWVNKAYLHVQRKKEEELTTEDKVLIGIKVSRIQPEVGDKEEAKESWESRPGGIFILRSSKRHDSDTDKAITALDVLFGPDAVDPRPNWQVAQTPLLLDAADGGRSARLSVRHGRPKVDHKPPTPRVGKDGKFKILQVSDAHLSTGLGACRDAIGEGDKPSTKCEADPRTLEFIETILDDEKPDLVVLSGDQTEGPAAPDTQSAIFKMIAPLVERAIPYAAIFGNHDDEGTRSLPRKTQMALLQTLPHSLSEAGPDNIEGVGNYYVEVLAHSSQHSALTLYMLDTHSLTPDEKRFKGYDWLKPGQIDWFRNTAQGLKKEHAKYSHIHMDMAFIHIPLPEYADRSNSIAGGKWKEGVTAPTYNSHFYDALAEEGVVAVGCGHDHVNDYCALRPHKVARDEYSEQHPSHDKKAKLGPWMCYAGGSGFGGYAGYGGFHRRVRVWEVDTNAGRLTTWKRVECCGAESKKQIDEMTLVEGGSVIAP
ncbi:Phosphatase DCR2 [Fulvia fulva]|uniref:Phosphatase DCR2 n=1 Tax=Passalora fulva TaxID=5499 RepID=A0A9Q8L8W8_PASFU|nr:Phosphatase DCR2 [Fulvia fulva]KAK4636202.1 Phosphatase DCR2 [Fulvia fulva]KAK4636676.1 Phosphatase DCR2 [Fulvia fulva]UJO13023.1 Phosphatase DCR2 [Fulvia fulva]WPV08813.1 Phosphatase DCR2 [Fulvia fulva]WPV23230.1 Phosphatase DCR2 [Fulvia fulva]